MEYLTWNSYFLSLKDFFSKFEGCNDYVNYAKVCDEAAYHLKTVSDLYAIVILPTSNLDQDEVFIADCIIKDLETLQGRLSELISAIRQKEAQQTGVISKRNLHFDIEQACYLKSIGFSWVEIASMFEVSRMTLYNKRKDAGILEHFKYSDISEDCLENIVRSIKKEMPAIGERMICGILKSEGIFIQRRRIRQAIHSVDPINTASRWHQKLSRRTYNVPGPMSLWHIGNILYLNFLISIHM